MNIFLFRDNFRFRAETSPCSFIIAFENTIGVRDGETGFIDELSYPGHLREEDLFYSIAHAVIIRMQSGCEEGDGNAFRGVAVVVAACVDAFRVIDVVQFVVERQWIRQGVICLDDDVVEFRADAIGAHNEERVGVIALEIVAVVAADHIHIELRLNLIKGHNGIIGVVT